MTLATNNNSNNDHNNNDKRKGGQGGRKGAEAGGRSHFCLNSLVDSSKGLAGPGSPKN